jgi:two-component system OmpR family sensor kinase
LSTEQIGQVFDAFWRADASRTQTGVHFGLGLALVRRTVLALGGTVTVNLEPGGVFAVRLVLPAIEVNMENRG